MTPSKIFLEGNSTLTSNNMIEELPQMNLIKKQDLVAFLSENNSLFELDMNEQNDVFRQCEFESRKDTLTDGFKPIHFPKVQPKKGLKIKKRKRRPTNAP